MNRYHIAFWMLVFGLIWNVLGWLSNNLLLGTAWDAVGTQLAAGFAPPWGGLVRELMSLVSDFVHAFVFVWLFAQMREQTARSAIRLMMVIWLAGAATTYLALVNSGFLPLAIATQTGFAALAIFVATVPLLPWGLRRLEKRAASP